MELKLFDSPIEDRPHPSGMEGRQRIYRFPNGYGASIVRSKFSGVLNGLGSLRDGYASYTSNENEWELAVIKFKSETSDDFDLVYDTKITDYVIGYLDAAHVEEILWDIKRLK